MSFNYTPPPPEVVENGKTAAYILYASLLFVPNVKAGALICGIGTAIITWNVCGYAEGDMGGLSQVLHPPIEGVIGAFIGACISFISKQLVNLWRRQGNRKSDDTVSTGHKEGAPEHPGTPP